MPPRERARGVVAALRRDLRKLPVALRDCTEAAAALELAKTIDQGLQVSSASKQLAALMVVLRGRALSMQVAEKAQVNAPEPVKESPVADLSARIAARRGSSAG